MRSLLWAALMAGFTTSALAKAPLSQVREVNDGLIAVGIALEISEECDTLSARQLRGLLYLNGLRSTARKMGYTSAEIENYVDDKAQKNRLIAKARKIMAQKGVVKGKPSTYCALGRAEIAKGSAIGRLLR